MTFTLHAHAHDTFVPMLENLSGVLDHGGEELLSARLAPDMFTLAQQVQQACYYAADATARLSGAPPASMPAAESSFAALKRQIADTVAVVRAAPASAFDGAAARNCNIDIPGGNVIALDGAHFLTSWALPHFYFHVVAAYCILRHHGAPLGKMNYSAHVGRFIRPAA